MFMESTATGQALLTLDGEVVGIAFGSDATTEHECGIGPIMDAFDRRSHKSPTIKQKLMRKPGDRIFGIEARRIHRCPELRFEDDGHDAILTYGFSGDFESLRGIKLRFSDIIEEKRNLACAWSDSSFGIRARGPMRPHLLMVKELLESKRAAILLSDLWLMRGFNILDATKFPDDMNEKWITKERKDHELHQLWEDSGIERELKAAGLQWFSLGSRVIQDDEGTLRTWLNPPISRRTTSAGSPLRTSVPGLVGKAP